MATHSRLLFFLTIISLSVLSSNAVSEYCGLAIYWFNTGPDNSLTELCRTGTYRYVLAAEAPPNAANVAADVRYCQSLGIKVFVSVDGPSTIDPPRLADLLWGHYIEVENEASQFFGSNLDGIDFGFLSGPPEYYQALAEAFRKRINNIADRKIYLTASPACAHPSPTLQTAIDNDLFDFIWPNFFNAHLCDYTHNGIDGLVSSWNKWIDNTPSGSKFFMGLPASEKIVITGFVPRDTLAYEILPRIRYSDSYIGVKLKDWYRDNVTGYGASIRAPVCDYTNLKLAREE